MTHYTEFSHFARDFFLYTTYFPLYVNERDSFHPKLLILQTKTTVCEMSSAFSPYMRKYVFEKSKNIALKTDEDLLRFLLPRCLKIHTKNHVTLTAVMSLIHEFLLYLQMNRLCFRFHFTAYRCLFAVFCRRYREQWAPMDGWNGFRKYVNLIKTRPSACERASIDQETMRKNELQTSIVDLLKQLENENGDGFDLLDYELSMIAEDNNQSLENDTDEVDDDPFVIDLTPPPQLVEEKSKRFDAYELGIPIASLLPVPPYKKPKVYSSSNESESSGSDSPSESDLLPPNSDLENHVSDNDSVTGSYRHDQEDDTFDEEYESSVETRTGFTPFELYTSVILQEAAERYGAERFRDKLLQRKCEFCGIKCYQFSYNLFKNQLHSAIVGRSRTKSLT